jgi:hypothetical protein
MEFIDLSVLVPDLFPSHDVEISAKELTKAGSDEIKVARPHAICGILGKRNLPLVEPHGS